MCSHCDIYLEDLASFKRKPKEPEEVRPVEVARPVSHSGTLLPSNLGSSSVRPATPTCSKHSAICTVHHNVGGSVYTRPIEGQIPHFRTLTKGLRQLLTFLDELPAIVGTAPVNFMVSGIPYPSGNQPATVIYILEQGSGKVLSAIAILGCRPDVIAALFAQDEVDKLIFNGE